MRLIDADELEPSEVYMNYGFTRIVYMDDIDEMTPVDAEPVRHGQWINDKGIYRCTACNTLCAVAGWAYCIPKKQMYEVFKFCPECGAKMDEVVRC